MFKTVQQENNNNMILRYSGWEEVNIAAPSFGNRKKNLKNQGFSYRGIAETLQCSKRITENAVTYKPQTETLGRKTKITPIIERNIISFVKKNPFTTFHAIKKEFS